MTDAPQCHLADKMRGPEVPQQISDQGLREGLPEPLGQCGVWSHVSPSLWLSGNLLWLRAIFFFFNRIWV